MYEDPMNENGGRWVIRVPHSRSNSLWMDTVLAVIGNQLGAQSSELCGVVLAVRKLANSIRIWQRGPARRPFAERFAELLGLAPTQFEWQAHQAGPLDPAVARKIEANQSQRRRLRRSADGEEKPERKREKEKEKEKERGAGLAGSLGVPVKERPIRRSKSQSEIDLMDAPFIAASQAPLVLGEAELGALAAELGGRPASARTMSKELLARVGAAYRQLKSVPSDAPITEALRAYHGNFVGALLNHFDQLRSTPVQERRSLSMVTFEDDDVFPEPSRPNERLHRKRISAPPLPKNRRDERPKPAPPNPAAAPTTPTAPTAPAAPTAAPAKPAVPLEEPKPAPALEPRTAPEPAEAPAALEPAKPAPGPAVPSAPATHKLAAAAVTKDDKLAPALQEAPTEPLEPVHVSETPAPAPAPAKPVPPPPAQSEAEPPAAEPRPKPEPVPDTKPAPAPVHRETASPAVQPASDSSAEQRPASVQVRSIRAAPAPPEREATAAKTDPVQKSGQPIQYGGVVYWIAAVLVLLLVLLFLR